MAKPISLEAFERYSYRLANIIDRNIQSPKPPEIELICSLWEGEAWESVLDKVASEGSTWVVWWYDGVREFIKLDS